MGTNYTWTFGACGHCGRSDEMHVGKSSAGWSFSFRAWPHRLWSEDHPEDGYDPASPVGFPVLSRADWRRVFTEHPGELRNEYGDAIPNPLEWLDKWQPPTAEQVAWEDTEYRRSPFYRADPAREWRDAEGFRFYAGEFS